MKRVLGVVGFILLLVGLVWIGQGTGAFPYPGTSFMINQVAWAWYGAIAAALGIGTIVFSRRL